MVKKLFALASVTSLAGLVAAVSASGCSSSIIQEPSEAGVGDAAPDARPSKEAGAEVDAAGPPEDGTVGRPCATTADCKVAGSINDNVCSAGTFTVGDLYGSPICIQLKCTQGPGSTVGDLFCDGAAGLCLPTSQGSRSGICLPYCAFDSTTITTPCSGGNRCSIAYVASAAGGKTLAIGYCEAACQADADCKGTAGEKCQVELGQCVSADRYVTYPNAYGTGCSAAALDDAGAPLDQCNCNVVGGTGANKDKGVCTRPCVTGAAGNTACNAAVTGWACTAKLSTVDATTAKAEFSGQPDGVYGQCALPCADDTTCAPLAASSGAPMRCKDFAGGKFCETSD